MILLMYMWNINFRKITEKWGFLFYYIIIIFSISAMSGLLILSLIVRIVVSNINSVKDRVQDIADGEGDLTKRLPINHQDEVGDVAANFNKFIEKLQKIISSISNDTNTLASSASDLSSLSTQIASNAEEISTES